MTINNPYPGIEKVELEIEAKQFGREAYCIPTAIKVVDVVSSVNTEMIARRRGYSDFGEMIAEEFYQEVERHVVDNSHEFL
jgi:hypothetical protein